MISGKPPIREPAEFVTVDISTFTNTKGNCKVCYTVAKEEMKAQSWCSASTVNSENAYTTVFQLS